MTKNALNNLRDGLKVVGKCVIQLTTAIKQDLSTARYERCKKFIEKMDSSKSSDAK